MEGKIKYEYSSKLWKHNSPGGWYFVSLPKTFSKEIRENQKNPTWKKDLQKADAPMTRALFERSKNILPDSY